MENNLEKFEGMQSLSTQMEKNVQKKDFAAEIKAGDISVIADKYLTHSRKSGYDCPNEHCHNGSGKSGTGAEIYHNTHNNRDELKCQVCGKNWNGLELIAQCEHLNLNDKKDFIQAVEIGQQIFNLSDHSVTILRKKFSSVSTNENDLKLIQFDITCAQRNLEDFLNTQNGNWRGLILETLKKFHCGYIPKWTHPKNRIDGKFVISSRRVIIPTPNHYNAVMLASDRTDENKKWWKMHAGSKEIFGAEFLPVNADLIIVTEGEIDAMSIWQASNGNFDVIAIGGAGEYKKAVKFLQDKFTDHKPQILILFDSDDTGRLNTPKMRDELLNVGFPAVCKFLSNENSKLDANQILQEQGDEKLNEIISSIVNDACGNKISDVVKSSCKNCENRKPNFTNSDTSILSARVGEVNERTDKFMGTDTTVTNSQNTFAAAEKEIAIMSEFNKKADEWKIHNGEIDSATLVELRNTTKYFDSLTAEDITAEIIYNSKRKIAMCRVYDFCALSATSFIAKISDAITTAENKIRAARKDNTLPPVSSDVKVLAQVSIRDLKADLQKLESQVNKERASFLQRHDAEVRQQKHEKFLAKLQECKKAREEQIRQLQQGPLTDEVVAEIIENVRDNLTWIVDKYGERVKAKATAMNFREIFSNDPNISGLVAYDEFQQAIVFAKKPTWKKDNSCIGEMWQDSDDSHLRVYLRETYQELAHEKMTDDYLTVCAHEKSFHVVKDFLADLPKWDGKKRAEEIFIKFLKVEDTPYAREVTKKFLLAAMSRIYHPGCNFQSALVLQGAQSIGKSYVFERLGSKWHTTLSDNVDDPHAIDALQNSWIVEMKEFSAARKADVNALKSFIERSADNRRTAYARRAQILKRHCVFAITVNDNQFLRDQTGNRRFWILKCQSKMFEIVEGLTDEYIQQVWAEVKQIYAETFANGFDDKKLQLSFDSKRRAEEIADGFMQDDGMKGEIESFLQMKIPYPSIWKLLTKEQRRKFIADGSIMLVESDLEALHTANGKISNEQEFRDALDNIGKNKGGIRIEDEYKKIVYYKIYGVELRKTICAAEILNECFGNGDRRKSSQKINEILPKIKGWQVGERQSNYSGYGDQKKIFYRVADEEDKELQNDDYKPNEEKNYSVDYDAPQNDPNYAIEEDYDRNDDEDFS